MSEFTIETIKTQITNHFDLKGEVKAFKRFGNGHINDTLLLTVAEDGEDVLYVLQRINHNVFKKPFEVMENILNVTEHIAKKLEASGGDVQRGTMHFLRTLDGKGCHLDGEGNYWRMYRFIGDTISLDLPETPEDFYQSAVAFGSFQKMLSDFPSETLHETIAKFHHTPDRFNNLMIAIEKNLSGRLENARPEVDFALARKEFCNTLEDAYAQGKLPLRVTHNDTKLNNVLLDATTRKQVCVIDLDTIMPGYSVTDFGDSIRFGASTAAEDEKDLDKVHFDINLFKIYLKGFIEGCDGGLTPEEIELLPEGAKIITFEIGMRFLTDYIDGDTYFRTHYPEHNLVRARTQFKLVAEMEEQWDEMKKLVRAYL